MKLFALTFLLLTTIAYAKVGEECFVRTSIGQAVIGVCVTETSCRRYSGQAYSQGCSGGIKCCTKTVCIEPGSRTAGSCEWTKYCHTGHTVASK